MSVTEAERSTPTFMVKECSYAPYTQYGTHLEDLDVSNVTSIQEYTRLQKARILGCWTYSNFSVPVDDQDESSKRYHFLEYSGTRQLPPSSKHKSTYNWFYFI